MKKWLAATILKFKLFLTAAVVLLFIPLEAQAGAFDTVGLNAGPVGMGQAFTSCYGGLSCVNYNPAGLTGIERAELLFSYRNFYGLDLLTQKYFGLGLPERYFDFGFSFHRIGTTRNVDFVDYFEDKYTLTISGDIPAYFKWMRNMTSGVNLNFFRVDSESSASGYGLDWGIQYRTLDKRLRLGLFNRNFGDSCLYWDTGAKDMLRSEYVIGAGYLFGRLLLASVDYGTSGDLNAGTEIYLLNRGLILRGGIRYPEDSPVIYSTGFSVGVNSVRIDYAMSSHDELGLTHFFTLNFKLNRGFLL